MSAGKFCEIGLRLLQQEVLGSYIPFGKKIPNFADECRKLVVANSATNESLRLLLPRALVFMYTMRNKRGIGHVGGDVEANAIDSATLARMADWSICELIRVYHALPLEEAQTLVDNLAVRNIPTIWQVGEQKRVLAAGLSAQQQTLLLMYAETSDVVLAEDLCAWVEYATIRDFRRRVLEPLHGKRLIEYDRENDVVHLSPLGAIEAERLLFRSTG
jgi:hypothetical protein